jgi:hypothetical protein
MFRQGQTFLGSDPIPTLGLGGCLSLEGVGSPQIHGFI